MAKPMILVVDDQPVSARLISLCLEARGFDVETAAGGEEAIDRAAELNPDAVLLDITMVGLDGFQVMDELRGRTDVPIILAAGAATTHQVRLGLDRGADDYVTKPFSPDELAARVRAVLRRGRRWGPHVRVGRAVVDFEAGTISVSDVADRATERTVSRSNWRLLEALLRHEGKVMYHDELLTTAFGPDFRGDRGHLQEQIRRLRRALGIPSWSEGPIRTVPGIGYVFDPSAEVAGAGRRHSLAAESRPRRSSTVQASRPGVRSKVDGERAVGIATSGRQVGRDAGSS